MAEDMNSSIPAGSTGMMDSFNEPGHSGPDPFESQNFISEHYSNGTSKALFDMRNVIDRKNLAEPYIGQYGIRWDTYGECRKCEKECRLRCANCPWIFYCCKEHQVEDWANHKIQCKNVVWSEDGHPRAGKDLATGTTIMDKSSIFVSPRFHTDSELRGMTIDDFEQILDGPMRPCFGCHVLIQPYLNSVLICDTCNFPMHSKACQSSGWHKAECQILARLNVQSWYEDFGNRDNIMIHLAVLRGVLLKQSQPLLWAQIIALDSESIYLTSESLKNSTIHFVMEECQVNWIEMEEIVKFLSIYMKHRLNCCMICSPTKKMVSVICSGGIPFTLVKDENANIQGGVYNYRMRMIFRTVKPVLKGELLTIGRGGS